MKNLVLLFSLLVATSFGFAQDNDPVILTINGENIYASEFLYIYTKKDNC